MTEMSIDDLRQWIGRSEEQSDLVTASLIRKFGATFADGLAPFDDHAPLGLHWCLSPMIVPPGEIGADGHPARGGFLPPVPLESRMWAGGELTFHAPLRATDVVVRKSTITDVALKSGKSGQLVFVTVRHDNLVHGDLRISEIQNLVYKDKNTALVAPVTTKTPIPEGTHVADPVLLFRYSAMTFNGHRIHYDRDYAMTQEGYSGLVVHGPLQATLLMNHAAKILGRTPTQFKYRGVAPLIAGQPFVIEHDDGEIWVRQYDGPKTMAASFS